MSRLLVKIDWAKSDLFQWAVTIGAAYFGMKYLFSGKLTSAEYLKNVYSIKNIAVLHESSFSKEVANSKLLLENAIEIISKGKKR